MTVAAPEPWRGVRWEGDETSRPLGSMERLLNARRSWSGAMTTAHVSVAVLKGPPPTEAELLDGLTRIFQRHPLLSACVRGKSNHHIPDAKPYPMHSDYINRAFYYNSELYHPEPNLDIQRFEPSPLPPDELAKRALRVIPISSDNSSGSGGGSEALEAAWRSEFDVAMDETSFDEDGDGPLISLSLYSHVNSDPSSPSSSAAATTSSAALLYRANHAVSDQLSFNRILSELLEAIAASRAGSPLPPPTRLPLPPSVEGALLGREQRQNEEIKGRLELIVGSFTEGLKLPFTQLPSWAPKALPAWEAGRVALSTLKYGLTYLLTHLLTLEAGRVVLSTIKYGLWQAAASGAKVLPRWVPSAEAIEGEEARWEHMARRTRSVHRSIDKMTLTALVAACRAEGITVSGALCAAAVMCSSDAMGTCDTHGIDGVEEEGVVAEGAQEEQKERYKLLQALDMRGLASGLASGAREDWASGAALAGTGSLDILLDLSPSAGATVRESGDASLLWTVGKECHAQTRSWIEQGWGRESLLLFSCGWEFMNMNRVVELGSQDRSTLGRAYSAGVSNVGRYAHETVYGDLHLERIHFGISQSVSSPAISTSAVTVDGTLFLTTSYPTPIWSDEDAEAYADSLVSLLQLAALEGGG